MGLCSHPNVMGIIGWFIALADNHGIRRSADAEFNFLLVMELMDDRCVNACTGTTASRIVGMLHFTCT
jgi:hypothetical protein